ncbi:hypothetical protein [Nonomuraea sp. SYSU D8015]|uniref:hypothetical protein n=1 Tax=Nonomuraea sp. SYSU D8015 TaxID=2593644 RepID=UPI0016611190|nr:hypothetical protein [Nonomuraea sp. SYSU D8015]
MPSTPVFLLPYPSSTDAPNGPAQFQALAEAVETALSDIHNGLTFGGAVTVNGNLSTTGTLSVSSTSTLTGNTTVGGTLGVTGAATVASLASTGNVTARGLQTVAFVAGKKWTGVQTDTTRTQGAAEIAVSSANIQNVPVVSGRMYRVKWHIEGHVSGATDGRIEYKAWNGSVGTGTQLGETILFKFPTNNTRMTDLFPEFIWKAASTETIANINLGMRYFDTDVGASCVTRVHPSFFSCYVEDIGLPTAWTGVP